jgi:glycosyltransferase involved in cell wall biosynthesis
MVFSNNHKVVIPNCIDFDNFKVLNKESLRSKYQIDHNKKVLLFVSDSIDNKRKGMAYLLESIKEMRNDNLLLLTIGNEKRLSFENIECLNMGKINTGDEMCEIYNLADIFVLPSIEDNLPNVMLEAWACGVPVISFDNGGMKEHVLPGINGELVKVADARALSIVISESLKKSYNSSVIREIAIQKFSEDVVTKKYLELIQP